MAAKIFSTIPFMVVEYRHVSNALFCHSSVTLGNFCGDSHILSCPFPSFLVGAGEIAGYEDFCSLRVLYCLLAPVLKLFLFWGAYFTIFCTVSSSLMKRWDNDHLGSSKRIHV